MTRILVLKISGKILEPGREDMFRRYTEILGDLYRGGARIAVVTGGGGPAREYIRVCRDLTRNEGLCDVIGIEVSRVNALLLSILLGDTAYRKIPRSFDELFEAWSSGKIVVLGGIQPGQSTSAVAAAVAEALSAEMLIFATVVDGVYDRDPREPGARLLEKVSVDELRTILSRQSFVAGGYELLDPVALRIIERSRIATIVLNGMYPENILRAVRGESVGTRIVF